MSAGLAGAVWACGPEAIPGLSDANLALHAGDTQSGTVDQELAAPLAVRVSGAAGGPIGGAAVVWTVASGGGTITATTPSGADGVASATYRAGVTTGPKIIVASFADAAPVQFTATIAPGPAARLTKLSADGQQFVVGSPSAPPLRVSVTDAFSNPVPGVVVTWTVTGGNATVTPSGATDTLGQAAATVTVSSAPPTTVTVQASAAGLTGSPVTFTGTATLIALVATVPVAANYGIHDQFVRDGLVFVSAWNTGLMIYDVGNGVRGGSPANPQLVSTIVTAASGVAGGAQVHNAWWFWNPNGQKRYVFVGQEGPGSIGSSSSGDIHVVDITNIAAPVEVAFFHMQPVSGQPAGVHNFFMDEANSVLYAAYYNGGVVALDVSGTLAGDLATREIARVRPGGANTFTWGVHFHSNGSLYATDMLSGFYQLTRAGNVFTVAGGGGNVTERFGSDQWVHGNYAYSGTWGTRAGGIRGNAVKIWSLSGGGAPTLVDSIITPNIGTVSDVEVSPSGTLLMFSAEGGSGNGIYFYSLAANPAQPQFVAYYAVSSGVHTATFATIGGRLYAFAAKDPGSPALLILDVTALLP